VSTLCENAALRGISGCFFRWQTQRPQGIRFLVRANALLYPQHLVGRILLGAAISLSAILAAGAETINSVRVEGTRRSLDLAVEAGQPFDQRRIEREVRRLWLMNLFDDVQVKADRAPDRTNLVFRVVEKRRYFLREVLVEPRGAKLPFQLEPGTFVDSALARQFAVNVRRALIEEGHADAEVSARLLAVGGAQADMLVRIDEGPAYHVANVAFVGLPQGESAPLRQQLRALRSRRILPAIPGLWKGWRLQPAFTEQRAGADIERLRSYLLSRGYLDAEVRLERREFTEGKVRLTVAVNRGARFSVRRVQTKSFTARSDLPQNTEFLSAALCRCLIEAQREADREGRLDFEARIELAATTAGEAEPAVDVSAIAEPGVSYRVRRIDFRGNRDFSDATLRRTLRFDEGDIFDAGKLRRSLLRLNRISGLEPLNEASVSIVQDPTEREVELTIAAPERKRGRWSASGPLGPASLSGPVQLLLAGRLPAWGGRLLDLSTYSVFASLSSFSSPLWQLLGWEKEALWTPAIGITRAYLPGQEWRSGFTLSPKFGWPATGASYVSTQARTRLSNLMTSGSRQSSLLVPVLRRNEESPGGVHLIGHLLCGHPQPRWPWTRKVARLTLQCSRQRPYSAYLDRSRPLNGVTGVVAGLAAGNFRANVANRIR